MFVFWGASLGMPLVIIFLFVQADLIVNTSLEALLFAGIALWTALLAFYAVMEAYYKSTD